MSSHEPWKWQLIDNNLQTQQESSKSFTGFFGEEWYQGRGVFGGLTAAVLLEAMLVEEPLRSPRSFTIHCTAPVISGEAVVQVFTEHRGKKVTHLSGRLLQKNNDQNGEFSRVVAFASASFGDKRSFLKDFPALGSPQVPSPSEVREVPTDSSQMPSFSRFFSYRFCIDSLPYSKSDQASLGGWIDLHANYPLSFPYIAILMDAWPPAVISTLKAPVKAASIDFTYHFLCNYDEIKKLNVPFLYRGEQLSLYEGYAEERNWLWDAKGKPVATARQLYAIG